MNRSEETRARPPNDVLDELFRHASPRTRPPEAAERAARAALHAQWRDLTAQRRRRRIYWPLAAAAALVLALGVAAVLLRSPGPVLQPVEVATVEVVVGTVVQDAGDRLAAVSVSAARPLQTGAGITTRVDSGIAMRWRDGSSVRLDQGTRVWLTAAGDIALESGRLYVDAEESTHTGAPVIVTPAGRVRHLGTQYMAAVSGAGITVSVRRGRVRLEGQDVSTEAYGGEQLRVEPSGSTIRRAIPTYGDLWHWTQATAPAFYADGRTVADFLEWVGRESGRSIDYASPRAEQLARQAELRGRIDMEPMKALAAILQTSDLGYEARDGSLLIRPPGDR